MSLQESKTPRNAREISKLTTSSKKLSLPVNVDTIALFSPRTIDQLWSDAKNNQLAEEGKNGIEFINRSEFTILINEKG